MLATQARAGFAPDDAIEKILRERVDQTRQSLGIVAAVFDFADQKIVAYGRSDAANGRPLDGDTVFEIGSITKVFTALLLTEMVTRGEVALDDPASKYLPGHVKMPERNGKKITLLDLATYTSGLPRIPDGIPSSGDNPYAAYTVEQLYAFLSGHSLRFDPGTRYIYTKSGIWTARPCARAEGQHELRRPCRVAYLRAAGTGGYAHLADAVDAGSSGAGPSFQSQAGIELGSARLSPAPARCGRPPTICSSL